MVNGKFPPGLGVKDVMENLQHKLYILEQKRKPVKGALETVVEDDGTAEGGAGTAARGAGAEGASSGGVGAQGMDGKVASMSGVSAVSAANNEDAEGKGEAVPNGHEGAEPSEKPLVESGAPKVTEGPSPKGNEGSAVKVEAPAGGRGETVPGPVGGPHPELDEDDARIYGSRPDGWVHPASLVFAMYGRPSAREDGDLKMQDGGGPSERKRKAREMSGGRDGSSVVDVYSSSDMDADGGNGNPRALGGSEEPRSRAKARRENERRQLASESLSLQKEVLQHIMNPAGSKHEEALVSSLQAITEVFVGRRALDLEAAGREREAAARARWQQKTDALQAHLKLLQQLGRGQGEEADRVANQLFSHLETAIAVPAIPPTHT